MFTNLFKASNCLFLLLLLCLTVYGYAYASNVAPSTSTLQSVKLFTTELIQNALNPDATKNTSSVSPNAYYNPSLVATDDMMIAVVGVNRTDNSDKSIDILTNYIEINDDGWSEKAVADLSTNTNWKAQLAIQTITPLKDKTDIVKGLLAAAKSDQVYLLLVNYTNSRDSLTNELDLKLVVGTVKNKETSKQIEWNKPLSLAFNVSGKFKNMLELQQRASRSFSGSAFFTKEGKIVFALVVDAGETKMTALIHSKNSKPENEFAYEEIVENCYPYYVSLEGKIIRISVYCREDSERTIMEFSTSGQQWSESKTPLFQQYNFLKDKYAFVTVKNETKDILLFLQYKKTTGDKEEFFLWIFDGTRVGNVGIIDTDFKDTYGESVFYANNSLFLLLPKLKSDNQKRLVKCYFCA